MRLALAAFTPGGAELRDRLSRALPSLDMGGRIELAVFDKNTGSVRQWTRREFASADAIIFIGAAGIAVRLVAPLLESKDRDPAVLVLDEKGAYVIPLLSGHIGGANRLARALAELVGATAVVTTATDLNGLFAVDEWSALSGCVIDDVSLVKDISGALLRGEAVGFASDFPVRGGLPQGFTPGAAAAGACLSLNPAIKPFAATLNIIPKIAVIGAGCRKGAGTAEFERFALDTLAESGISIKAVRALASIDLKRDEPCMTAFAAKYGLEFRIFSAAGLNALQGEFAPSDFVRERTGVDNVCERAAVAAGGVDLRVRKTVRKGMTLAVGLAEWYGVFDSD